MAAGLTDDRLATRFGKRSSIALTRGVRDDNIVARFVALRVAVSSKKSPF